MELRYRGEQRGMTMVILPEVLTFFGLHREFSNAGYFETEQAQRIALALKPAIHGGDLRRHRH
jgi:hypothetical protein